MEVREIFMDRIHSAGRRSTHNGKGNDASCFAVRDLKELVAVFPNYRKPQKAEIHIVGICFLLPGI
jgi:hypothetical protein